MYDAFNRRDLDGGRDGKLAWWRNCATEAEALDAIAVRR